MGYPTIRKVFTDDILKKFDFWSFLSRNGSTEQGIPGLSQKFKEWDRTIHPSAATVAAIRALVAVDIYDGMKTVLTGATPEIFVFSATNTTADDGATYLCPDHITHPAAGRWVKRSEATGVGATVVTMTAAAASVGLVLESAGASRVAQATTLLTSDIQYRKCRIITVADSVAATETALGFSLPAKAIVEHVAISVDTAVGGSTVDVGTLASAGGDADGFLAAATGATTGIKDGPLGVKQPFGCDQGGRAMTYTASHAHLAFKVVVEFIEIP